MTSRRSPAPELLHRRQHLGAPLLGQVEPELLRLDANRVEPALLAEHDRAFRGDELGRVRLDRLRVVELRGDRPGLAPVQRLAGQRLPRLELVAGQLAHARRHLADAIEPQVRLDAVERPQRQRDLAEVRVAGALAHAVDRPVHVRSAGAHRGDRRRRGDAEVVVAVEVHRHVDELGRVTDELRDGLGRRDPERVHDDDFLRPRLDGRGIDLVVELALGPGRVDSEERGVDAVLGGEAHRAR